MSGWRVQQGPVSALIVDREIDSGLRLLDNATITKVESYGFYLDNPGELTRFYPWSNVRWVRPGFGAPSDNSSATLLDHSGTISVDGVSQVVMDANPSRQYLLLQNVSDEVMWVSFGTGLAIQAEPSSQLYPGSSLSLKGCFISSDAINIICSTSGKSFVAKEDDSTSGF